MLHRKHKEVMQMIVNLTLITSPPSDSVEFSYADRSVFITYKGEDDTENTIEFCMHEVVALKAWCELVIDQDNMR